MPQINVIQCVFGQVPYYIQKCIDSVKHWSDINDHKYNQITDWDNQSVFQDREHQYAFFRGLHEKIFLDYLAEKPYTLCVDFDIYMKDNFTFDLEKPCYKFASEWLIYNADDLSVFKQVKKEAEGPSRAFMIYIAMKKLGIEGSEQNYFDPKTYEHLNYSIIATKCGPMAQGSLNKYLKRFESVLKI